MPRSRHHSSARQSRHSSSRVLILVQDIAAESLSFRSRHQSRVLVLVRRLSRPRPRPSRPHHQSPSQSSSSPMMTVIDNQVWILYRFCMSAMIKQRPSSTSVNSNTSSRNWRQHHQLMLHLQSAKIHPPTYTAFQTYN
eukprot:3032078-Rhodomonas_salina.1